MTMTYRLETIDETTLKRINGLLETLKGEPAAVTKEDMDRLLADGTFNLFVSEDPGHFITGMLTLSRCNTLSGDKFWIEDVVVDDGFRGRGIGRSLIRAALDFVRRQGRNPSVYLTSNPSRTAARSLYRSEGFDEYETGVFRITKLQTTKIKI